ncbi:MAG: tetratricopeptide repeat protein [Nibricoccus sp.]
MTELARKRWWQQSPVLAALLVVVTLLTYFPAWNGGAVFDDDDHLTPPELSSLDGLARIWTDIGAVSQYYPITHSVFWLEQRLWGHEMLGYHLVNILLHASAALLFVAVLKRLSLPGAWLAGAIFALHPVHAESVAWISELKNTLSTVFYLGAALAYLRFDQTRRLSHYVTALLLFVAALLSKTVTASLPAALLVIFWWKRGHLSRKTDVQPLLPFFALGISAGLLTAWVERTFIGAQGEAFVLAPMERVLIAGRAFWFYLGKIVWPAELIFIYPRWEISASTWWQYLFPATGIAFAAGLWRYRRHMRGPLAAVLFFAGTLFPVLGFLNVYPFIYSFVADHYQYLASLGIIAALATTVSLTLSRFQLPARNAGTFLCVALLAILASLTWRQSKTYTDTETLWQATLARNPACFVAHSNLGNFYLQQGRVDDSIRHTQKAMELRPGFAEIHNNLGTALLAQGRLEDALGQFRMAVKLRPTLAVAHYNIATVAFGQGRFDEAETHFRKAVELRPDYVKAQNNLGSILLEQGRVDEAAVHIRKALNVHPDDPDALTNLGNIYLRQGQIDEAIAQYQSALAHSPNNAGALTNLGSVFLAQVQTDQAIAILEKAARAQPELAVKQLSAWQRLPPEKRTREGSHSL